MYFLRYNKTMGSLRAILLTTLLSACTEDATTPGGDGPPVPDQTLAVDAGTDLARPDGPGLDKGLADLLVPDLALAEAGQCPPGFFVLKGMGKAFCVPLPAGVVLPVDSAAEANLIKAAAKCACKCDPGWTQKGSKWRCYCCSKYPDCLVEIEAATAATRCEQYG